MMSKLELSGASQALIYNQGVEKKFDGFTTYLQNSCHSPRHPNLFDYAKNVSQSYSTKETRMRLEVRVFLSPINLS